MKFIFGTYLENSIGTYKKLLKYIIDLFMAAMRI